MTTPSASSAAASAGPMLAACPLDSTPASAIRTNGVAIPSLRPLSTLISRRIRAGTIALTIMPAPKAAAVGGRQSRADQHRKPDAGSPDPGPRQQGPQADRRRQPDHQQANAQPHVRSQVSQPNP